MSIFLRIRPVWWSGWAAALCVGGSALVLTGAEQQPTQEWQPLFDGRTLQGWRQAGGNPPLGGWKVEAGILKKIARERGGNLVTDETFDEFELAWEWRLPARANSGVKYFVREARGQHLGHEYQMIDDSRVNNEKQRTGAFYDVLPPKAERQPPRIGDWNESRILVRGQKVEHWLNGELILAYELGSAEVLSGVARSKFRDVAEFGRRVRGRIMLTDHGDEAWFRNLRIRVPNDSKKPKPPAP